MKTELLENGSLFSLAGKRSMVIDDFCFTKRPNLCLKATESAAKAIYIFKCRIKETKKAFSKLAKTVALCSCSSFGAHLFIIKPEKEQT